MSQSSSIHSKTVQVHDFSNDNPEEAFEKCIPIFSAVNACISIDPTSLSGSVSAQVFGVSVATTQFEIGKPVTLPFRINAIGQATFVISVYLNDDNNHAIKIQYKITGPFGFSIANDSVNIYLPF